MKRLLILFIISAVTSWGQETETQNDILDIPNTDLVKDFNLKIGRGNIIPVKVIKSKYSDEGFPFTQKSFSYNKEKYTQQILVFKNKKLLNVSVNVIFVAWYPESL